MKKVKIMLTAVAVMAVVGGALAFNVKAQKFCYYKIIGNECPLVNQPFLTTFIGAGDQTVIVKPVTGCPALAPLTCTASFSTTID